MPLASMLCGQCGGEDWSRVCSPWCQARNLQKEPWRLPAQVPIATCKRVPGTAGNQAPTSTPAVRCDTVGHERGQDLVAASAPPPARGFVVPVVDSSSLHSTKWRRVRGDPGQDCWLAVPIRRDGRPGTSAL